MLNFNSMELMFAYQNRVINPNNVKKLLQHLLKIMAASESINKELEEAALSIITKYDIPVPIEVAYLPFNSLQKFMKLPQYYLTCDMAAELLQLDSPNFSYPNHITNYKYKNLESKDSGHIKIPPILHHIWLTDPNNPQPIRSQDVANAIETNRLFQSSTTHQWQQIIWVHNKTNLLSSIKQLSNTSIVVKEYHTLAPHLLNYDLVEQHSKLFRWGIASDTLRYDLVRYMGGVYADINFIFNRVPDIEINRFDFFSTSYSMSNLMAIDNFFFAAKPDHPVIARVQDTVRDNLIYPSFSLATIYNASLASFTDYATAAPIGDGYFKAAHQNDNIDVIFPKPPRTCELDSSCSSTSQAAEAQDQLIFNLMNICPTLKPDLMLKIQQEEYAITHGEMCAVPHNIIGIDSTDGRTWDNQ